MVPQGIFLFIKCKIGDDSLTIGSVYTPNVPKGKLPKGNLQSSGKIPGMSCHHWGTFPLN